jgi:hypothetical protein
VADGKDELPSFSELRDAMMPSGTNRGALWDALKNAQATGGHVPGQVAPDISMPGGVPTLDAIRAITGGVIPPELSAAHDRPPAGVTPGRHDFFLPADPFGHDTAPAIALAELYNDMLGAGIPLASVERILGAALAAMGKDEKPGG